MARTISRSQADLIEELELDGAVVVTVERIATLVAQLGWKTDPRQAAYELQRAGWLGKLRTQHVWEFLPASRGGAYGAGDRFIEFRAQKALDPDWPGLLAMESAASVLGLAQRVPEKEVVALPKDQRFPKALDGQWRCVRLALPDVATTGVNGLPSWTLEGLLVGVAARPSGYADTPGLAQWVSDDRYQPDIDTIIRLLEPFASPVRQRAAYLLGCSGNSEAQQTVIAAYPPTETAWLGPRQSGGRYDPASKVSDTLLHPYLDGGSGA